MQSRPLVYVSRITNLSDARYCAGMGADLLGFVVDPSDPDYVSPESYHQLIGWISGPARVAELGKAAVQPEEFRTQYAPEYLHIVFSRLPDVPIGAFPLIVELSFDQLSHLPSRPDIAHLLVTDLAKRPSPVVPGGLSVLAAGNPNVGSVVDYLARAGASGIALQGSRESAPGLKDYDHLSRVLEELNG